MYSVQPCTCPLIYSRYCTVVSAISRYCTVVITSYIAIVMAALEAPEDGYDFVERPSEDFFCPVTLCLLQEPHLTPCCGNHLSQEAVSRLQGQPCPVCKETNPITMPDKFFQRKVNELKVRCPSKGLGCKWVGELGSLNRHLSQNSVEGECRFATVACPYSCGDGFQRCQLEGHRSNDCPNRPFTCRYCNHKATYIIVTTEHLLICRKYPIECPYKSLGCQWAGERGDLDQHLNENSVEGECQFMMMACPYSCGDNFQRCQLKKHKINNCPSRPFTCQYCNYEATYTEVTTEHWPLCEKYLLPCSNDCGGKMIERQDLKKHLDAVCPLQVIKCEFSYAGCEVECQRQHMQDHVSENMKTHLSMVSTVVGEKVEEQKKLKAEIAQQDAKIAKQDATNKEQNSTIQKLKSTVDQQQKQIVAFMSSLTRVALDMQKPLTPVFVTPPDMVMTDFEEHRKAADEWYSPPFYSHIGGYKMCLNVNANGFGYDKGTHVSVYVYLMRGEYDDHLKWLFRGDITIQLLNQKSDEGHKEATFNYNNLVSDKCAGRVVGQERADGGRGSSRLIAHSDLNTEDREYLKNDCLKFRIPKIVVRSI